MKRRHLLLLAPLTAFAVFSAFAQSWPTRPTHLVVPFPPGGGTDGVARAINRELGDALGQPVLIENRPGAGGLVAWTQVAKASPDGYTLVMVANNLRLYKLMQAKLDFDPDTDLVPVAAVALVPMVLAGSAKVPAADIGELVRLARESPGKYNYGIVGGGSPHHLAYALLSAGTGVRFTLVSYKGTGPLMNDLLGAQIEFAFVPLSVALPQSKGGRLRIYGLATRERSGIAPEVATLAEKGGPAFDASYWFAVAAPRGTPRAVLERLNGEINKVLALPHVRQSFFRLGFEPMSGNVERSAQMLADEVRKWSRPIADYNIRVE